jgi:hypothetical protein
MTTDWPLPGSVGLGVNKFAFPAAGAQQLRVDLIKRRREDCLQLLVRSSLAGNFLGCPPV